MPQFFAQSDIDICLKFGELLNKAARFDVSTREAIELSRCFVWYNGLAKKIEDHILEIKNVVVPKPEPEKKTRKPRSSTKEAS
jgi:hypothetical protein